MNTTNYNNLKKAVQKLYCCTENEAEKYFRRFDECAEGLEKLCGKTDNTRFFSAPGRTEIGGNHTDHQHGKVLCGSVNVDILAAVSENDSDTIRVHSKGHGMNIVKLDSLEVNPEEISTSTAIIRGIVAKLTEMGYSIKGFDAYTVSDVPKGSGLSSSAAYEVLIGNILNSLFCNNEIDAVKIAQIGQYSENVYFGKPCGLMDQMASSVGGVITIDFNNPAEPIINKVNFNLNDYALCIIDSCADHADLTDEYAAVPAEMKQVAYFFNKEFLRDVNEDEFYQNIRSLREKVSDRAVLRAMHFFADNKRVPLQSSALERNDFDEFNRLVTESGHSSYMYLQNVYASKDPHNQAVSVVLALCDKFLEGKGSYRVHGGGFAGTVQAFVPVEMVDSFKQKIEKVFGENTCHIMKIRSIGATEITERID